MKFWYTTDFIGHCPTKTCAIAVAVNKTQARRKLRHAIIKAGLSFQSGWKVHELPEGAKVICDGDY